MNLAGHDRRGPAAIFFKTQAARGRTGPGPARQLEQGKKQVELELKQAQDSELFCLREHVVSSFPRSGPETPKTPFFLAESHSKR